MDHRDEWDIAPQSMFAPQVVPFRSNFVPTTDEKTSRDQMRTWNLIRIEQIRRRIELLSAFDEITPRERYEIAKGRCVYLMRCPSLGGHKIGSTGDLASRMPNLRIKVDPQIELHASHSCVVCHRLLESALHSFFRHRHSSCEVSDEVFKLCQAEIDGFGQVATSIENKLLPIEILHLEGRLATLKAELSTQN